MSTNNSWLSPLQRSYQDIKNTLINRLRSRIPEITDYSEGNIFTIFITVFAAIAETLHYYIDNTARESFLTTARRYSSVYRHAKSVDYHIKCANPATVDLNLSTNQPPSENVVIPLGVIFTDSTGDEWVTTKTFNWPKGVNAITISVAQKKKAYSNLVDIGVVQEVNSVINLTNISPGFLYVEGSMNLQVSNETWTLVETFAYSNPSSKHYMVEVNEDGVPTIQFGNGKYGQSPVASSIIKGNFYITRGASGNISSSSINTAPSDITDKIDGVIVSQLENASGGANYEGFDEIKKNVPLSIKTLGVAITKEDYEAISRLAPGVDKSYVNYICGRFVEIYITPQEGTIASQALIDSTLSFINKSKVITTSVSVKPTSGVDIYLEAEVTGKKSFKSLDINEQVIEALVGLYNVNTSSINKPIRLSDIYSIIDNQTLVDYLTINKLYLIPKPFGPGVPLELIQYSQEVTTSDLSRDFYITIESSSSAWVTSIETGQRYFLRFGDLLSIQEPGLNISFTIDSSINYNPGDTYTFQVLGENKDLIPNNYTIPIFNRENIKLTIHEEV